MCLPYQGKCLSEKQKGMTAVFTSRMLYSIILSIKSCRNCIGSFPVFGKRWAWVGRIQGWSFSQFKLDKS